MKIDFNPNYPQPNTKITEEHSAEVKTRADKVENAVKNLEKPTQHRKKLMQDPCVEQREKDTQDIFDLDLQVSRNTQLLLNDNDGSKYCGSKKDDDCTECGCHTWCSSC